MCDQKQLPGFSVWAAPHHPAAPRECSFYPIYKSRIIKLKLEATLMVHGDEPAGCCLRDKDIPVALRSFHTWREASVQSQRLGVVKGLYRDAGT